MCIMVMVIHMAVVAITDDASMYANMLVKLIGRW